MRVAFDATALLGARTGVGVFAAEVLTRLPAAGFDVVAYAASWRGRDQLDAALPPGVTPVRRPMAARPLRAAWLRTDHPRIERWTGTVDLVHGPNYVVPPTRARALVSVHDLTPLRFPELANDDTRQYPALLRRALARGSEVQTGSAFIAAEIVELLGAAPDRVHVVPYGVTVGAGDPAKGRAQAGGPYVLALGTVEPRKDLPSLVKAFDAVAAVEPELRLVVAGPDGWGVEAYAAAVAAAHHRDRIVRLGWVADDARADLLAGAAVFAYPSRYEGFGLPPLEAMAAGVPVVTTAAGSLPEVVGDAAVLVEPGDVGALATGLTLALSDEATRAGLVERGRARAAGFSWDRCGAEMAVLYRSLIAS